MAVGKSSLNRVAHASVAAPEKGTEKIIAKAEPTALEKPAPAAGPAAAKKPAPEKAAAKKPCPLQKAYALGDELPVWLL